MVALFQEFIHNFMVFQRGRSSVEMETFKQSTTHTSLFENEFWSIGNLKKNTTADEYMLLTLSYGVSGC